MPRFSFLSLAGSGLVLVAFPASSAAVSPELLGQGFDGGAYLSWWKLLSVGIVFLVWVRLADWLNRDTLKIGEDTGLTGEAWNPVQVGTFLVGFFCAISIPIFWVGFPLLVLAALAPTTVYWILRRGELKANPGLADKVKQKPGAPPPLPSLPQDEGVDVKFTAAGPDDSARQSNLIRARQSPSFVALKELIDEGLRLRTERMLFDFTREAVSIRREVDGTWHALPPLDRPTGDALLIGLKYLAGLDPNDRRSVQEGTFGAKTPDHKLQLELKTQGVATGERAQLRFLLPQRMAMTVKQLGMLPEMTDRLGECLNNPGITAVSAPPSTGLSTTWQSILLHMDRITRDCVALVDVEERETDVENIQSHTYNASAGETPATILRKILLSQPDCLVVPSIPDGASLDDLVQEVNEESRTVVTRIPARSAAEALLRLYALSNNRPEFSRAMRAVTGQRLLRRLCEKCRVPVPVQPQLIQKLGGDPRRQKTLYKAYRLPPPEQQVDEEGNPTELKPCPVCAGIGYIGRIAAFEAIFLNDAIRETLRTHPKVEAIEKVAQREGKRSLLSQGYQLVLLGVTSIEEVQRVMKKA